MGQYCGLWELLKGMESPWCDGITWVAWKASMTWKVLLKGLWTLRRFGESILFRFQRLPELGSQPWMCVINSRLNCEWLCQEQKLICCWGCQILNEFRGQPIGWSMSDVNSRYQYKFYRKFVLICVYSNIIILVGFCPVKGSLYSTAVQFAASCIVLHSASGCNHDFKC